MSMTSSPDGDISSKISLLRRVLSSDYKSMLRDPGGALAHRFIVPGSAQYLDELWDWDAWLTNVALKQIALDSGDADAPEFLRPYERGSVLNFLNGIDWQGWVPISMTRRGAVRPADPYSSNMHKPCLAQHVALLIQEPESDIDWIRESFYGIQAFLINYRSHHRHAATGLYFWQNDACIAGDNDPCTYGRPPRSSGSIFLNCMMVRELRAAQAIATRLGQADVAASLDADANALVGSIQTHCWDEWTGFYYSVDLNVGRHHHASVPDFPLHAGNPMDWPCLLQRVGVWSGFLALWAGVATPEQARRMASEHLRDPRTFYAAAGVRTLSKLEKMYSVRATGNPSCWLGPVWGVSNYLVFRGLVRYGLDDDARDLCDRTIRLFAADIERSGALHEYYEPDTAEPLLNRGFQNWNLLVLNMAAWREGRTVISEF